MNQLCVVLLKCHCVISVSVWFSGPAPPIHYPACLTGWLRVRAAADKAEIWQRSHHIFSDGEQTPARINKLNHRSFFTADPTQMSTDTRTLSHTSANTLLLYASSSPLQHFPSFHRGRLTPRTRTRGGFICAGGWRSVSFELKQGACVVSCSTTSQLWTSSGLFFLLWAAWS